MAKRKTPTTIEEVNAAIKAIFASAERKGLGGRFQTDKETDR